MQTNKNNPLFINKNTWSRFSDEEMEEYVMDVFSYYRRAGFPYFPTSKTFRMKEYNKLMNYDASKIITDDGVIKQTMHGLSLAWSYMPHSWSVRCDDKRSVMDTFNDDELFLNVIRKRIRMGDNMSDNGIRKMLKLYSGTQAVSNFRPTAACALYEKYAGSGATVLDMSMGYGGRLLGAYKADVNYIGYDPSTEQYNGIINMHNDFGVFSDKSFSFNNLGSEYIDMKRDTIDFAFTSPPYFNTERYSEHEATQSHNKYPIKERWLNEFLAKTFDNVYNCLVRDGRMAINIANVKSYPNLCEDTLRVAERCGFKLEETLKLALSNSNFKKGKEGYKYEPVFVFRRY